MSEQKTNSSIFTMLLLSACLLAVSSVFASAEQNQSPVESGHPVDFENLTIDSIEILNRNIYDNEDPKYSGFIFKLVNKFHLRTKTAVVRRELLFKIGDIYSADLIDESARNLRRRLALFDAWIIPSIMENGKLLVRVVTVDQWSLATGLNIKKDGNDTDYKFFAEDKNLLGNNQLLAFEYIAERREDFEEFDSERNVEYFAGRFSDSRLLGSSQTLSVSYSGNPSNKVAAIGGGMPYYDFTQKWRYELLVFDQQGRRDFYQDEELVAEADYASDDFAVGISRRFGPYKRKLRFNLTYQYLNERALDRRELTYIERPLIDTEDSTYHSIGFSARASTYDFVELRKIDGVGYTEDFTTGSTILVGIRRANDPGFDGYRYHKITSEIAQQWYTRSNLISVQLSNAHWFKGNNNIRDLLGLKFSLYNNGLDFVTLAVNGRYLSNWYPDGSENLNIGGTTGVRSYDTFYRSGNRRAVLNVEGRFFPNLEILSAVMGGVLFLDVGRTWRQDQDVGFKDFLVAAGVGLRIHLARLGRDRVIRVDFGYSETNNWQILIGTNQYFRAALSSLTLTNL